MLTTALLVVGAALLAGSGGAKNRGDLPQLASLGLQQSQGPVFAVRHNELELYEFQIVNARQTGVSHLQVDIFLPKQMIDLRSIKLWGPRNGVKVSQWVVGQHIHWVLNIPPRAGFVADVHAHILRTATSKFCNKYLLTLGKKVGDYSPGCILVK